jgi:hypothetical protein
MATSPTPESTVLQQDAPADQEVGMQATAAELPPAADREATVDAMRLADRRQPTRGQQVQGRDSIDVINSSGSRRSRAMASAAASIAGPRARALATQRYGFLVPTIDRARRRGACAAKAATTSPRADAPGCRR